MAAQLSRPRRPPLNPLQCSGTALPAPVLLMAKLVVVCVLLTGTWRGFPDPFVPFSPMLDHPELGPWFHRALEMAFLVPAVALLLNRWVRAACLVAGATFLVATLSSRPYFQNNRLFTGCLLFVAGLSETGQEPWLLRCQVALLYFGGGLNKLLSADWRSGRFFEAWGRFFIQDRLCLRVASWLPQKPLAGVLAWTTIGTEFGLSAGLLLRRFRSGAIWLGILFHTGMLFLTGRTYGMFYYAALASYLAFADWPTSRLTVLYDENCQFCARARRLLAKIDFDGMFEWSSSRRAKERGGIPEEAPEPGLHVLAGGKMYAGFRALRMMLLYNSLTYFALAVILAAPQFHNWQYRRWLAIILLALFSPIFTPVGSALYNLVTQDRHRLSPVRLQSRQY